MNGSELIVGVFLAVAGGVTVYEKFDDWRTPAEGTVEYVEHLYATGEIDHPELERRVDVLADPDAAQIRESVERVSGIGDKRSWSIAARYDTLNDLRDASLEELTDVPDIGKQRAKAIKEEL